MGIEDPMPTDFATQSKGLSIGRKKKFDGRGIKPDAVIERGDVMMFINSANDHHRHQDVDLTDSAWGTRNERFDREWCVGLDKHIAPGTRLIYAWKIIGDLIPVIDNSSIIKSRVCNDV